MDTPQLLPATPDGITRAAAALRGGQLVAIPTETVYGLAADATNESAVAAIFTAKGRPSFNPLIIHGDGLAMLEKQVIFDDRARLLADHFWPGPLTLVLPRQGDATIAQAAGGGLGTLAVRVPRHKLALAVISAAGCPVAAPSANRSGSMSPTTPAHVAESLGAAVPYILAGGRCTVGLESTVLDLTSAIPVLLRPGAVLAEDLEPLIGPVQTPADLVDETAPRSPGLLLRHYAPQRPLKINHRGDCSPDEAFLAFGPNPYYGRHAATKLNLSPTGDLAEAAANLFVMLRMLDAPPHKSIAVGPIPNNGLGIAINDRLVRAAAGSGGHV